VGGCKGFVSGYTCNVNILFGGTVLEFELRASYLVGRHSAT
jgi:hypothetical protein